MSKYKLEKDTRNPSQIWGKRINKMLNEKGMTQDELAEKSGVPAPTISGWICNEGNKSYSEPKIIGFKKVADTLGVSTDYLLGKNACKTPKNEEILKLTGLSDEALEKLKSIQIKQKNKNTYVGKLKAVNFLIENIDNTPLLEDLYNYLLGEYYFKSRNGKDLNGAEFMISRVDGEEVKSLVFSSSIGQAFFVNIQSDLVRLKDKINKQKDIVKEEEYREWEKGHEEELNKELFEFIEKEEGEDNLK